MLSKAMIFPSLPAVDLKRARKFYEEKLGLKVLMEDAEMGLMLQGGQGCNLFLYQRGATKADHTVAFFMVDDLESEMKELKTKGVKFEEYNIPQMNIKTVNGVATVGTGDKMMKNAWFKDSEGNILGIGQTSKVMMQTMKGTKVGAGSSR